MFNFCLGSISSFAAELPTGGKVEAGQASISQNAQVMDVHQTSQRAVLSWNSFDVAKGNTVNFNQPNANSVMMNRVVGATKSMIDGAINANGQVVFVNPNGVVFGKNAEVNVGGLIATSMNISNDDFMAAKDAMSFSGEASGKVVNQGRINVNDAKGYVVLMAPEVRNEGVVFATMSGQNSIALVSGQKVTLTFADRQLINVSVDASLINTLISNKRLISVNGGKVVIAANSANDLMNSVISNKGTVSADGVNVQGGVVTLTAGTVNQAGTVSANATATILNEQIQTSAAPSLAGVGGQVNISANQVNLGSTSKTSATGTLGGGGVAVFATKNLAIKTGALVDVSASLRGNGGQISLSGQSMDLRGTLIARSGTQSGNGGVINVSTSGLSVSETALVDASAQSPNGEAGQFNLSATEIIVDQTLANFVSKTLVTTKVSLNALKNMCLNFAGCTASGSGLIALLAAADISKETNTPTALLMKAEGKLIIEGSIQSTNTASLDVVLESKNSVVLEVLSSVRAQTISVSGPVIEANGNLFAYGSNNSGGPFMALFGAKLVISGRLRSGSKQNPGRIKIQGNDEIIIRDASITTEGDEGGLITIISSGNLLLDNAEILTNGGNGRGGSLDILAGNVTINRSILEANGFIDGGRIQIIANLHDVNFQQSIIQTNGSNGLGGTILSSGVNSTLIFSTEISATGFTQGGTIKIGNDAISQIIPFSSFTYLDSSTILNASHQVSDSLNRNGGYIETSGHTIYMLASINAGRGGIWLLDPTDIVISSSDPDVFSYLNNASNSFGPSVSDPSNPSAPPSRSISDKLYSPLGSTPSYVNVATLTTALNNGYAITITTIGSAGSGNGDIFVNAPITANDGSLSLTAAGAVNINNAISLTGSNSQLYAEGMSINIAANITTTLSQQFNGPVIISNSPTLTSNGNAFGDAGFIVFGSSVDAVNSGSSSLNLSTRYPGAVSFGASVGSNQALSDLTVTGHTLYTNGSIRTIYSQEYGVANIRLAGDTSMSSQYSSITIYSEINETDEGHSLILDASSGLYLYGEIGRENPITNLEVRSNVDIYSNITTVGSQEYLGSVIIRDSLILTTPSSITFGSTLDAVNSVQSNLVIHGETGIALSADVGDETPFQSLKFEGPVSLLGSVAISTEDGTIHFNSTIVSAGHYGLTLSAGLANVTLEDSLGFDGRLDVNNRTINGLGAITFNSPVIFGRTSTCTSCGLILATENQPITLNYSLNDAVDGRHDLIISAGSSQVNLFGSVGATKAFASLEVWGTANLSSSISTTGNQNYHNSVALKENVAMTSTVGDIVFWANVYGDGASVIPRDLIQFLGNGDYIYNNVSYTADILGSNGVTYDAIANTYQWTPSYTDIVKALVVGGGGAGGGGGGGGGAGGVIYNSKMSLVSGTTYTIAVGAGGDNNNCWWGCTGNNGRESQFQSLVAIGGGGGAGWYSWGASGGSSGGAGFYIWQGNGLNYYAGTQNQGNTGAGGANVNNQFWVGGGGGGAGSSPSLTQNYQPSNGASANGGSGIANNITGQTIYYGGGGGGSSDNSNYSGSTGGIGGGGSGGYWDNVSQSWLNAESGLANTGGGGGGSSPWWRSNGCWCTPPEGNGGSGTVIIARPNYGVAVDLTIHSGGKIISKNPDGTIRDLNVSNINKLDLASSGNTSNVVIPVSLIAGTTGFTKGGTDSYVVDGLGSYSHTLTVNGGTLLLTNSPSNNLNIDTLVLNGGALVLDQTNPQNLILTNLDTYANSPITNAQTVTVSGVTHLGSEITSIGDISFAQDVILWNHTTLTSTLGNVNFAGKVVGYVSTLQFLGNGEYIFQEPNNSPTRGTINSSIDLPGGFSLTYSNSQYGFTSLFNSQGQLLIVGGGGAGSLGGGGGGGVVITETMINAGQIYTVVVGEGGTNPSNNGNWTGGNGSNSQFGSYTAVGGGGGGGLYGQNYQGCCWMAGNDGGSGGGSSIDWNRQGGAGTPGQGSNGGGSTHVWTYNQANNFQCCYGYWQAGGGGGAGGSPSAIVTATYPGQSGNNNPWGQPTVVSTNATGNGGPGLASNITGAVVYYGAGGGGGVDGGQIGPDMWAPATQGGIGGGGNGGYYTGSNPASGLPYHTWMPGTNGASNTGSGGGGGGWCCSTPGSGGSGVVVASLGVAPNLKITAHPTTDHPDILKDTVFSHIGVLTIDTTGNFSLDAAGQIASSAGLVKMGAGTLTLDHVLDYAGSISVAGGIVRTPGLTGSVSMGSLTLANGGTFDLVSTQDLNLGSFTMVDGGSLLHVNNLNVSGQASLDGSISTIGSQTYNGSVVINSDVTIQTQNDAAITFNSTIDDNADGLHSLTLYSSLTPSGLSTINGEVGAIHPLKSLTVNSPSSLGGSINTTGAQTYNGDLILIADTTFNTSTGNININGDVLGDAFYPGVISFLGGGYYGYQTLGVGNITQYQVYQIGVGTQPSGVRVSYDAVTGSYNWISNYSSNIQALIVAGGGAGGVGGGGAGGFMYLPEYAVAQDATYNIVVGAGGVNRLGNSQWSGGNGGNSKFGFVSSDSSIQIDPYIALGGGGGASVQDQNGNGWSWLNGFAGGSGGGGSIDWNRQGGAGTTGQGNNGGGTTHVYKAPWCENGCYAYWQGGGGGGAGTSPSYTPVPGNPWGQQTAVTSNSAGNGGAGLASSITGSTVYYAGGGAGGVTSDCWSANCATRAPGALGGIGGGGNGGYYNGSQWVAGVSGTDNTGGGGGGGGYGWGPTGNGGSGIVILSTPVPHGKASLYLNTSSGTINFSGNLSNVNEFGISSNSSNGMSVNYAQVTDTLRVIKSGSSTLSINSWQNFQGDLVVSGGRLNLIGTGSTVDVKNLLIANDATLNITNSSAFNANGTVSLDGEVSSDYGQTYFGVTTIAGDTTLTALHDYVTFNSAVNDVNFNSDHKGIDSLTINGNLNAQSIGAANDAGELGIGSIIVSGASIIGGSITTLGTQSFQNIAMTSDVVLRSFNSSIGFNNISGNYTFTLDTPADKTINFSQVNTIGGFIKAGLNTVTINGMDSSHNVSITANSGELDLNTAGSTITVNNFALGNIGLATGAIINLLKNGAQSTSVSLNVNGTFYLGIESQLNNVNNLTITGNAILRSDLTTVGNQNYNSTNLTQSVLVGSNLVLTSQGTIHFAGGVAEYSNQTNYLQLLGNGNYRYTIGGIVSSGQVNANASDINDLQMAISFSNGQYLVTSSALNPVSILIVGGGGAGGIGGGGGGGVNIMSTLLLPNTSYVATIGEGGIATTDTSRNNPGVNNGGNGSDSQFGDFIALGGGGGGGVHELINGNSYACPNGCWLNGSSGGSGGGGAYEWNNLGGNGTAGQGSNGGVSTLVWTYNQENNFQCCYAYWQAGGGGGAGGSPSAIVTATYPGQTGNSNPWGQPTVVSTNAAGNGGPGLASNITGTTVYYGGGGGGGRDSGQIGPNMWADAGAIGGSGGGGNGAWYNGSWRAPTPGLANTGGGGGGNSWCCATQDPNTMAGGSGVVIVRQLSSLTINANAFTAAATASFAIGSLTINSNSNFSLGSSQISQATIFTKGGSSTLNLSDFNGAFASTVAMIVDGGRVNANHGSATSLSMNSLMINNGSTFDLTDPSSVDLTINSLFTSSSSNLLGLNSLKVNRLATLGGNIVTSGSQTYEGEIKLGGDTVIQTTGYGSYLNINASINDLQAGLSNLTLTVGSAHIYLNGEIGSTQAIGTLTLNGDATIGASISTLGNQTYNNDLVLTNTQDVFNDISMNTVSGNINFNGNVTGYRNTVISFLGDGYYLINGVVYNAISNPVSGLNLSYDESNKTYTWNNTDSGSVQLLVVGGGGAGGQGGGGGGGVISTSTSINSGITYSIMVGAGGITNSRDSYYSGGNGGNSQFGSYVAIGGGGGAGYLDSTGNCPNGCWQVGQNGGSGGGGPTNSWQIGGAGTAGQGSDGGRSTWVYRDPWCQDGCYSYWQAGGGGGAGGSPIYTSVANNPQGSNAGVTSNDTGKGGPGVASNITGATLYYGGGGGGGVDGGQIGPNTWAPMTLGGIGGGGNGTYYNGSQWVLATSGSANTGGGGGGGYWCCNVAGSGGSGVVILNGTLDSFSRANLSVTTQTGAINFAANKTLINIGALSISTNRSDQTLRTGLVTNTNTTSLVKGGSGTLSIAGLSEYAHTIQVTQGTLSLTQSPLNNLGSSYDLTIDTLILNGGGLKLDETNPQNLTVHYLTTYPGSSGGSLSNIDGANKVTVTDQAFLGSSITSIHEQHYLSDVYLWADTTLTSKLGSVTFDGNVTGFSAGLQFLGNGQYIYNSHIYTASSSSIYLGGGLSLSYSNGRYQFSSAIDGSADLLVVGGGGAGGMGGGGGGGVLIRDITYSAYSIYDVIVGAGGINAGNSSYWTGRNGGNSQFGSYIAVGGGGGAGYHNSQGNCDNGCWLAGSNGGSGGGASAMDWNRQGGRGTPGQGSNGGGGTLVWNQSNNYAYWQAGGGGGAGGPPSAIVTATYPGQTGNSNPWGQPNVVSTNATGNGGVGLASNITGANVYYGAGGGGGVDGGQIAPNTWAPMTLGGIGGGGNGAYYSGPNPATGIPANTWINGTSGLANTGSGGGGGIWCCNAPGSGGSGIVALQVRNTPNLTLNMGMDNPSYSNTNPLGPTTQFNSMGALTINTPATYSLNTNRFAGTQGLMKGGSGTLTLSNLNSYSGYVGITAGELRAPDDGSHMVRLNSLKLLGGFFNLVSDQNLVLNRLEVAPTGGDMRHVLDLTVNESAILGGAMSTIGSQTYNGSVVINSDVTIQTQNNAAITFNATIDDNAYGLHSLTLYSSLTSSGLSTINGEVGLIHDLRSLTVNSPSSLGGSINTKGDQTYNGDVRLVEHTSLNTATGNIYINGNVLGDRTYQAILQFLGLGNYRYQGVDYVANSGVAPANVQVSYDVASDIYTWTAPYDASLNVLLVGGGGAGGLGGGGGGGVSLLSGIAVGNGQNYVIAVGAGGTNPANNGYWSGNNGGNSQFDSFGVLGGGGGGGLTGQNGNNCCWMAGYAGGSGGGGSSNDWNRQGGAGTTGQGNNGGVSTHVYKDPWCVNGCYAYWQAGGGGGAGTSPSYTPVPGNPWGQQTAVTSNSAGNGGAGLASNITGSTVYYAGGGGGGVDGGQIAYNTWAPMTLGGVGGGGNGSYYTGYTPANGTPATTWMNATDGLANTGGGGGGGMWCCTSPGRGGSGVVILSIPVAHGIADLSLNSGTGQYFINGSLTHIGTLALGSNSAAPIQGGQGVTWSSHAATVDGNYLSDVRNFTKNGVDNITINSLRNNFGVITVNQGSLYLPPSDANPRELTYAGLSIAPDSHLYISNVSDLTVTGDTYLGNNLDITGSRNQTYLGPVQLGGNISLNASQSILFGSTIDGASANLYGLEVNAPAGITFMGNIGSTNPLAYLTVGGAALLPASVKTFGDQVYKSSVVLKNDTNLTASGIYSGVYLLGAVDAREARYQSLSITSSKTYLIGNIGQIKKINALTVNSQDIYIFADVYTANTQTYNGDVLIGDGSNIVSAIGSTLAAGISGVTTSFLANLHYTIFNYSYRQWHSYSKYISPRHVRTLISEDPTITFNGKLNDYESTATHTLLLAAISNSWETPTINFNNGSGEINRLYSINAQTMWTWDRNTSFGQVSFNNKQILTKSDQTYRTTDMNSMARNYAPINDMPPGKFTVISPNPYNPINFGITNGAAPGTVKILVTAPPKIGNLSTTSTVKTVNTSTGETTTSTPTSTFSGGSSGSTASPPSGGGSSGGGSSGGGSSGGGSSGGGSSGGGSSGGGSSGGGSSGGGSSGGGSSGGSTPPPVTVVDNNSNAPDRSGSTLGAISLGSIMQGLFGSTPQKSLPSLGGTKAPLGIAVVDVGAIQADCPTAAATTKSGECLANQ